MTALRVWLMRLRGTLFPARRDAELERELRHHLELAAELEQHRTDGQSPRESALHLGGVAQTLEAMRDQQGLPWLEDLFRDIRVSLRTLRRTPTFTIVAILTLGIGIGAATTIASVVDSILLRPLPYADADRLVRVIENIPSAFGGTVEGGPNFQQMLEWRRQSATLEDAIAVNGPTQRTLKVRGQTVRVQAESVSANTFDMLGLRAALGRTFGPADEDAEVAVLSDDAWHRMFQGDPQAIGTTFELEAPDTMYAPSRLPGGRTLTVLGVLPRGVELPGRAADFYTPLRPTANGATSVRMIGRLRPGVSEQAARDEANVVGPRVRPPRPNHFGPLRMARFDIQELKGTVVNALRPALRLLLAAAVVLLLITATNLANLLLARGSARQREMASRLALGSSRARLVRLVLSECVLLAIAGGALGAAVAMGGVSLVRHLATLDAPGIFRLVWGESLLPRGQEVTVNLRMFAIAAGLAFVTSVVFGLFPAWQASRTASAPAFGARGASPSRTQTLTRRVLALTQVTLATVMLVGAGLLAQTFMALQRVDNGFDPDRVLTFQLVFPGGYPLARKTDTVERVLRQLRAGPDVVAAGMTRAGILLPEEIVVGTFVPPTRTIADINADPENRPRLRPVSDGYLTAMSVPILDGREFLATDSTDGTPQIVISRRVAEYFFDGQRAVGQTITWQFDDSHATPVQVLGVVADVHNQSPLRDAAPDAFINYRQLLALMERLDAAPGLRDQTAMGFQSFAVRTRDDPAALAPRVSEVVHGVDPTVGVDGMIPMRRLAASAIARQRFGAVLMVAFAVVAAALAAIGVYGVLAYDVLRRTSEIGVRMALGAPRARVLGLIAKQGALLVGAGVAAGLVIASMSTTLLDSLLFGVTPLDPHTFLLVPLFFGSVAAVATYIPARRATRVEPMVVLRVDGN